LNTDCRKILSTVNYTANPLYLQVLQKRLDEVEKSSETLSERLGKAHEENEDLRFQVSILCRLAFTSHYQVFAYNRKVKNG
jgi:type II restriction/modification system DNA methylase subunit YeeA